MTIDQNQVVPNRSSMIDKLRTVFGVGSVITADYKEDGSIKFYDEFEKDIWSTTMPTHLSLFGPGIYRIDIRTDDFTFTQVE